MEELRDWSAYLAFFNEGSGTELRSLRLPSKYFTEPSPQPLPGFHSKVFLSYKECQHVFSFYSTMITMGLGAPIQTETV